MKQLRKHCLIPIVIRCLRDADNAFHQPTDTGRAGYCVVRIRQYVEVVAYGCGTPVAASNARNDELQSVANQSYVNRRQQTSQRADIEYCRSNRKQQTQIFSHQTLSQRVSADRLPV